MSEVGGVSRDPACLPQCPGGVKVLQGRQVASNHLFSSADNMLLSALVFGSCSSVADGDGGGEDEDGLSNVSVDVNQH